MASAAAPRTGAWGGAFGGTVDGAGDFAGAAETEGFRAGGGFGNFGFVFEPGGRPRLGALNFGASPSPAF
jgi:hypothetical protein